MQPLYYTGIMNKDIVNILYVSSTYLPGLFIALAISLLKNRSPRNIILTISKFMHIVFNTTFYYSRIAFIFVCTYRLLCDS